MKLRQIYHEEPTSTVTHDGNEYSVNKLLTATKYTKVRPTLVSDLKWILQDDNLDQSRVSRADLSAPILITKMSDGRLVVIDGAHRLQKAIQDNVVSLPAKFINDTVLRSALITK